MKKFKMSNSILNVLNSKFEDSDSFRIKQESDQTGNQSINAESEST